MHYIIFISICSVIGRGGEQINRLQAESGAKIQIAPGILHEFYLIIDGFTNNDQFIQGVFYKPKLPGLFFSGIAYRKVSAHLERYVQY